MKPAVGPRKTISGEAISWADRKQFPEFSKLKSRIFKIEFQNFQIEFSASVSGFSEGFSRGLKIV